MKIFIIGGTGFISGYTVEKLLDRNHHVTIMTRGESKEVSLDHPFLKWIAGDRTNIADLDRAIGAQTFDAVFDFVAYSPEHSRMAVESLRGKTGRFIHCSTVSVYMISWNVQCPITEDQDKRPLMDFWTRNPFGMEYGILKRQCEDVLWQAHDKKLFPVSMLRPTFVCGPGDPTRRDYFWIERILDGNPLLVPGSGDFAFQNVHVEDVAQAFVDILDRENSIGKAYNVASEEIFSLNDYLKALARLLNREVVLEHVEQKVFDRLAFGIHPDGDVFPFNTRRTAIFSLDAIKTDLDYQSTLFDSWMPKTIQWYLKLANEHSVGYERRQQELAFLKKWKNLKCRIEKESVG